MKKILTIATVAALGVLALGGCDANSKGLQGYQDAKVSTTNKEPAEIGTMPDGFSNYASKCDNGNRVYVLFHADDVYGGITVVPNDPSCD